MNRENHDNSQRSNPSATGETKSGHDSHHYFRENLQKQKEETKRSIEEKMKNTLKSCKNKPTFFKDKKG